MKPVIVVGGGRLGLSILHHAQPAPGHRPVAVVCRGRIPLPDGVAWFATVDAAVQKFPDGVVVDAAPGEEAGARFRAAVGRPLVVGTTGYEAGAAATLTQAATRAPVVVAPNFSAGIAILRRVASLAAATGLWEIGIVDRHHRAKRDAPSGTARLLADTVSQAAAQVPEVVSLRQGEVVGEHTLHFAGVGEELVFTHRATTREVFAAGAWRAVAFASSARPGTYSMDHVLGLTAAPDAP